MTKNKDQLKAVMPSYYVLGAAYGLVVQVYANAIRKVPAFRRTSTPLS